MAKKKKLSERREYKQIVHKALFQNEKLRSILIDGLQGKSAPVQMSQFKKRCLSHMFVDDTELEAGTYIYYDIEFPSLSGQIKECNLILYAICNRKLISDPGISGYSGDRIDYMSELIEESLINNEDIVNQFGIGELKIESVRIYNGTKFYGLHFCFAVPNFR